MKGPNLKNRKARLFALARGIAVILIFRIGVWFGGWELPIYNPVEAVQVLESGRFTNGSPMTALNVPIKPKEIYQTTEEGLDSYAVYLYRSSDYILMIYSYKDVAFAALSWRLGGGEDRVYFYDNARMERYLALKQTSQTR